MLAQSPALIKGYGGPAFTAVVGMKMVVVVTAGSDGSGAEGGSRGEGEGGNEETNGSPKPSD